MNNLNNGKIFAQYNSQVRQDTFFSVAKTTFSCQDFISSNTRKFNCAILGTQF